jgi:hypothetical protein
MIATIAAASQNSIKIQYFELFANNFKYFFPKSLTKLFKYLFNSLDKNHKIFYITLKKKPKRQCFCFWHIFASWQQKKSQYDKIQRNLFKKEKRPKVDTH